MNAILKRLISLLVLLGLPVGSIMGASTLMTTAQITVTVKLKVAPINPTVTVTASDPVAAEDDLNPGSFLLKRSGDTSSTLNIYFTLGGTAANGVDYKSIANSVSMPSGVTTKTIWIYSKDDTFSEGVETVTLTLVPNDGYTIGSPAAATIKIYDYAAVESKLWSLYE